jgi:hypothetical protein
MTNYRPADHAMGLELQLEELIEQRERARVQGRIEDVGSLEIEISALQVELAATAERAAVEDPQGDPGPQFHNAGELSMDRPPE